MMVDLRLLNGYTKQMTVDLSYLKSQLQHILAAEWFIEIDVLCGFKLSWVVILSMQCFTIRTPIESNMIAGTLIGLCNTPGLF